MMNPIVQIVIENQMNDESNSPIVNILANDQKQELVMQKGWPDGWNNSEPNEWWVHLCCGWVRQEFRYSCDQAPYRILDHQVGEGIECFRKKKAFHYFDTIICP